MADRKISQLSQATAAARTDLLPLVQSGSTKSIDVQTLVGEYSTIAALRAAGTPSTVRKVTLLGHTTAGDGGGGDFYWDSSSSASDNAGTVILPTGHSGAGRWLRVYSGAINVKWFGAKGDGSNDDTAEIQAAIDAATAGDSVLLPDGDYDVSAQLTVSKALTFAGHGATITETTAINGTISITASNVSVLGLACAGTETFATYSAGDAKPFILATSVDNVLVRDVRVTGKSSAVNFVTTTNSRVVNCTHVGVLSSEPAVSANGSYSFQISGGSRNQITGSNAADNGHGVLVGLDSESAVVGDNFVTDMFDSAIYVSSGFRAKVIGNEVYNATDTTDTPSGIKVRGSGHAVIGNSVRSCKVGIAVTGNGTSADSYGNNGHGNVVADNTIKDSSTDGISAGEQDDYYQRHLIVANNTIINSATSGGGFAAIRGWADYSEWSGNVIENSDGTTAAIIAGWVAPGGAGAPSVGLSLRIANNTITDSASDGIRISACEKCAVVANKGHTLAAAGDLIDARSVDTTDFIGNLSYDLESFVLRFDASCDSNRVKGNFGDRPTAAARSHILLGTAHEVEAFDRGSPEGAIVANVGSRWLRRDGGAGTIIYVKETGTGNTGWVASPSTASAHTWAQKQTFSGEIEVDGALNHDGSTVGFYGVAPTARPSAYTQTYATATRTHSNPTATTLTDNTAGTANTTLEALADGTTYANDVAAIRNNFADLAAAVNALIVDIANAKQVLNQVIDDDQSQGLKQ